MQLIDTRRKRGPPGRLDLTGLGLKRSKKDEFNQH